MRIRAHQHVWRYSPAEYAWIDDSMAALRRDILPEDLNLELKTNDFQGSIAVPARQSLEETSWLLDRRALSRFLESSAGLICSRPMSGRS
jgi:L-fuconolactonase